ncbi:DUF4258 domain-containing protein [Maribacter sp. 2307ULW6-5]|uniref:DUF4258 domain-containing protein n=1 Tax=Maribacter sp. 2307ULW6-5 TaxID=3386275 RepID=UPI0039BC6E80
MNAHFLKRLGYFLFGLSLGIVFLAFFLKKKADESGVYFCYLPNCRTLKDIRSKPFYYSEEVREMLVSKQLDTLEIKGFLRDGDVDFGASDTKSRPCKTYVIEGMIKGDPAVMQVENCPKKATLKSLVISP